MRFTRSFASGRWRRESTCALSAACCVLAGTEDEERIQLRVRNAVTEIADSHAMKWDAYIVNDDLDKAYAALRDVVKDIRTRCAAARAAAAAEEAAGSTAAGTPAAARQ